MKIKDYIDNWLYSVKIYDLKRTSFDRLERTIYSKIVPYVGDVDLTNLSSMKIQEILNRLMSQKYSHSEIKKVYNVFNTIINYALIREDLHKNPMLVVKLPSAKLCPKKAMRIFTDDEIYLILNELSIKTNSSKYKYIYRDAYILMLHTGLRTGEILSLRKKDYDSDKNTVCIHADVVTVKNRDTYYRAKTGYETIIQSTPKTESSHREIYLNETAKEAVTSMITNSNGDYLICNTQGKLVDPQQFLKSWYRILINAGIEKTGLHTLRHTFASKLFDKGCNVKIVSKMLGHASVKITYDTYIHLLEHHVSDAVYMLDNWAS